MILSVHSMMLLSTMSHFTPGVTPHRIPRAYHPGPNRRGTYPLSPYLDHTLQDPITGVPLIAVVGRDNIIRGNDRRWPPRQQPKLKPRGPAFASAAKVQPLGRMEPFIQVRGGGCGEEEVPTSPPSPQSGHLVEWSPAHRYVGRKRRSYPRGRESTGDRDETIIFLDLGGSPPSPTVKGRQPTPRGLPPHHLPRPSSPPHRRRPKRPIPRGRSRPRHGMPRPPRAGQRRRTPPLAAPGRRRRGSRKSGPWPPGTVPLLLKEVWVDACDSHGSLRQPDPAANSALQGPKALTQLPPALPHPAHPAPPGPASTRGPPSSSPAERPRPPDRGAWRCCARGAPAGDEGTFQVATITTKCGLPPQIQCEIHPDAKFTLNFLPVARRGPGPAAS